MTLEIILALIVIVPIAVTVLLTMKKIGLRRALIEIVGRFLLVAGLIILFPAFYLFFHGKDKSLAASVLAAGLLLTAAGYVIVRRQEGRRG